MLTQKVVFYGNTANKIRLLKDDTNLFERMIDVYITGGVIGMLFDKKGEEKRSENKATIFPNQISKESMRIKYLASLAFLIENKNDDLDEDQLLNKTFADWFANKKYDNLGEENKYKLFKSYAIGGIDLLYNKIIGDSTGKDSYLRNYYDFIKEIEKEVIDDSSDRAILSGLMN